MIKSIIPSWWLLHLWDRFLPLTALTNVVHGRWIKAWKMKRRRLPNSNSCLAMHFKAQHYSRTSTNTCMLGGDLHDFIVYHRPYLDFSSAAEHWCPAISIKLPRLEYHQAHLAQIELLCLTHTTNQTAILADLQQTLQVEWNNILQVIILYSLCQLEAVNTNGGWTRCLSLDL